MFFSRWRSVDNDPTDVTSASMWFHACGPTTVKATRTTTRRRFEPRAVVQIVIQSTVDTGGPLLLRPAMSGLSILLGPAFHGNLQGAQSIALGYMEYVKLLRRYNWDAAATRVESTSSYRPILHTALRTRIVTLHCRVDAGP